MNEHDFRASLTKEELERRAFIVPFKMTDFTLLERLNHYSGELGRTWEVDQPCVDKAHGGHRHHT